MNENEIQQEGQRIEETVNIKEESSEMKVQAKNTIQMIKGSFSLVIMTDDCVIGARDPNGIRPLCLGEVDGDGLGFYRRIADPEGILDAAVFLSLDALADVSEIGEVALAHVVTQNVGVAVVGVLLGEHAAGAKAPVGEGEVEFRGDVLR